MYFTCARETYKWIHNIILWHFNDKPIIYKSPARLYCLVEATGYPARRTFRGHAKVTYRNVAVRPEVVLITLPPFVEQIDIWTIFSFLLEKPCHINFISNNIAPLDVFRCRSVICSYKMKLSVFVFSSFNISFKI